MGWYVRCGCRCRFLVVWVLIGRAVGLHFCENANDGFRLDHLPEGFWKMAVPVCVCVCFVWHLQGSSNKKDQSAFSKCREIFTDYLGLGTSRQ